MRWGSASIVIIFRIPSAMPVQLFFVLSTGLTRIFLAAFPRDLFSAKSALQSTGSLLIPYESILIPKISGKII